jgi:hypothetical protein
MRVLADDEAADDDALYARALALGLDRNDLVVRRLLVQKMRLLAARAGEAGVGEAELRAYYARHRDDYRQPHRVTAWHVFVATAPHGGDTQDAAARLLSVQRAASTDPATAASRGDPFAVPPHLVAQSPRQLETLFGATVTAQLLAGAPRTWIGPLRSPAGAHLFWIEHRDADAVAPFEAVRGRVLEAWRQQNRAQRLAELVEALRVRQPLRVESAAWRARSGA